MVEVKVRVIKYVSVIAGDAEREKQSFYFYVMLTKKEWRELTFGDEVIFGSTQIWFGYIKRYYLKGNPRLPPEKKMTRGTIVRN